MDTLTRWLGLVLVALAVPSALRAEDTMPDRLQPFRADYLVRVDGKDAGESRIELQQLAATRYQHRVYALGTRGLAKLAGFRTDQSAELELLAAGPRLTRAEMSAKSLLRDRDLSVRFDWLSRQIHWQGDIDDSKPRIAPLQGTPATGSSLNLQLGLAAQQQPAGARLEFVLHDRGEAKPLDYTIGEAETIEVPAGRFRAIPIRGERHDKQRITTAWYAAGLPPTPVRVLQTERGKEKFELRLQQVLP
ncbi:DUF3108 domain-containing protein [Pseudomarimonas arenosa]|uniref:DUF3108 domain-containing protein n=1 Tax=Pseudomarimonas arenosa TaxID=2774145 RepID=A0AAW3ZVS3_9GAMM|nr:DUF3108 domain-containing protein [Pseudomarimonas arenosa]MBD8528131.1 DUF3108 domain-containing protein [Pseudomarimonas arenosa]